jgi:MoxR-like ATPase
LGSQGEAASEVETVIRAEAAILWHAFCRVWNDSMTDAAHSGDDIDWVQRRCEDLIRNVEGFVRGKTQVVRHAVVCLLAEGHLLVEDVPGVAKTSLAKAIAQSVSGSMRRIQFTPDLLPSDVVGVQIYDIGTQRFEFHPGPVFANVVLGDEINRASPKTQSALLEVMAERQVTVDGVTRRVPEPCIVIATQNPIDQQGTYALPEAQMDRFMMVLRMGYPDAGHEARIVEDALARQRPEDLKPVVTVDELLRMMHVVRSVYVAPALVSFIVSIVAETRTAAQLRLGASPRASNALALASQAHAALEGREFVTADDVKAMAPVVLCHRLLPTPEASLQGSDPADIVATILRALPTPNRPAAG